MAAASKIYIFMIIPLLGWVRSDFLATDLRHGTVIRSGIASRIATFIVNFWFEGEEILDLRS
jgi:hypothetical protein